MKITMKIMKINEREGKRFLKKVRKDCAIVDCSGVRSKGNPACNVTNSRELAELRCSCHGPV